MSKESLYSVIIPVYNSEKIVETTVERTLSAFSGFGLQCEIILVNDGSTDNSWSVIKKLAENKEEVISINLLRNYGQHTAVLCGIRKAKGDFLITLDDDLQNPPEEIIKLINKIDEGYDLVFAKFRSKKHNSYRKLGTILVGYLNSKIFKKPKEITLSNFRIFRSDVAMRISDYKTSYPYIPGLLLMLSSTMANVETEHKKREVGKSNYSLIRILKLMARLLFNYSSYPLKVLTAVGFVIAVISFLYGLFVIIKALYVGTQVEGWTTLVVLLSFFNGFLIIMLGTLGEYITRIMNQMSIEKGYQIKDVVE